MKKLLVISLMLAMSISLGVIAPTFADTKTKTEKTSIASSSENMYVYDNLIVSPVVFNVKTGQSLNLNIQNLSTKPIYFKVPSMNVNVEVDKNSKAVVPLSFSNPTDKTIWFRVQQGQSNNKQGSFNVADYTPPVAAVSSGSGMDDSFLKNIINYDSTFTYNEKPEPEYKSESEMTQDAQTEPETPAVVEPTPKPAHKSGGYVRGYW